MLLYFSASLNVFSNPNAANFLETVFPDKVVVYGVVTEYCIKEAVEGIARLGFSVVIVKDAIKEISREEKRKLFSLWESKGIEFTTASALLKTLSH